jgi:hypothetical protein
VRAFHNGDWRARRTCPTILCRPLHATTTPESSPFPPPFKIEYVLQDEWCEPNDGARAPSAGGGLLTWARRAMRAVASAITPEQNAGEATCVHKLLPVDSSGRICHRRAGLEFGYAMAEACHTGVDRLEGEGLVFWSCRPGSSPLHTFLFPVVRSHIPLFSSRPGCNAKICRRSNDFLKGHRLYCCKTFITIDATTLARDKR